MQINLLAAWIGILLGFLSGLALGLFFHREDWLGGYGSFKRRLYRLAHISLFGLGAINLFFYFTAHAIPGGPLISFASSAFIMGAITMPICCLIMAHFANAQMLFALPVLSLVAGGILTIAAIYSGGNGMALNPQITQP